MTIEESKRLIVGDTLGFRDTSGITNMGTVMSKTRYGFKVLWCDGLEGTFSFGHCGEAIDCMWFDGPDSEMQNRTRRMEAAV